MSRAGYSDDCGDYLAMGRWRGQLASAIRGKRGQAFLIELVTALEALPQRRLIANALKQKDGEVCALGAVGVRRGIALESIDPDDYDKVAQTFGIAHHLAREVEYQNDEGVWDQNETPEARWARVHEWAKAQLKAAPCVLPS